MKKYLLFLFLALATTACQTAGEAPLPSLGTTQPATVRTNIPPGGTPMTTSKTAAQAADLAGVWVVTNYLHSAKIYWILSADGKYAYSPNLDGSNADASGKFWFNMGQLNIIDESLECNTPGKYQARITSQTSGQKKLSFTLIDDQCQIRVRLLTGAPATWLQSLSPVPSDSMTTSKTVSQAADLAGVWAVTSHPDYAQVYWILSTDGKYAYSTTANGSDVVATGKFWFDNGQFNITDNAYFCPTPGKYQVQVYTKAGGQKMLAFTPIDDQCQWRVSVLIDAPATWFQSLPAPSATP